MRLRLGFQYNWDGIWPLEAIAFLAAKDLEVSHERMIEELIQPLMGEKNVFSQQQPRRNVDWCRSRRHSLLDRHLSQRREETTCWASSEPSEVADLFYNRHAQRSNAGKAWDSRSLSAYDRGLNSPNYPGCRKLSKHSRCMEVARKLSWQESRNNQCR